MNSAQTEPQDGTSETTQQVASWYELDAANYVTAVSPDWDSFAQANQGEPGALAARVIGRRLDEFISGDVTRMFMSAALQATRLTERAREIRYRCDSPRQQRVLRMRLEPLPAGGVRISHQLVEARPRATSAYRKLRPPPAEPENRWQAPRWRRCSQCLHLQRWWPEAGVDQPAEGLPGWPELADVGDAGDGDSSPAAEPPQADDWVCPACQEAWRTT